MSEEKSEAKFKYLPNATTITNKSLDEFPNVQFFFETLLKNTVIETKAIGRAFQYHLDVESNRYYTHYGLFMDYFIRKHLSNQFNIEIRDLRTEHILNNPNDYIIGSKPGLHDAIKHHYEIFKDPKTEAMDIIRSVKIVSFSHTIFFNEQVPTNDYTVDENNLREIIGYCKNLPYSSVVLNPVLSCDYFNADADLMFDDEVIYEIKTSKFKALTRNYLEIPKSKFYQPIIYGFGYYKNHGIKIKNFKIYNPLLGYEYSIVLDDIDFELFENVLERDVAVYSRLTEIYNDEMVLDMSLFSNQLKIN